MNHPGFRQGKTPWHKTPLKNVIAIYEKPKGQGGKRWIVQVKRWDSRGRPFELYKDTILRAFWLVVRWKWYKWTKLFRKKFQPPERKLKVVR